MKDKNMETRAHSKQSSINCTVTINGKVFKVENKTFNKPKDIKYKNVK